MTTGLIVYAFARWLGYVLLIGALIYMTLCVIEGE